MGLIHFEDTVIGGTSESAAHEMTRDEIIAFAVEFDPQPFHIDEAAAKTSLLGGLAASGWHTAAVAMRLFHDSFIANAASMGGPGIDELKWLKPVRPGDRLHIRCTVLDKRASRSRPEMGLVTLSTEVIDQRGQTLMTQLGPIMLARRGVPPAPRAEMAASTDMPREACRAQTPFGAIYFEDLALGNAADFGTETLEKDAILRFARAYDPQPFHTDEAAAKESHFGRLVASGWHTAALWMKHWVAYRAARANALAAAGMPVPSLGPSPGFRKLKWLKPVGVGDTLSFATRITGKRASKQPGWGLIFAENTATNQTGARIFEFQSAALWQKRP